MTPDRPQDDAGNALIIAVMVVAVCLGIALIGIKIATGTVRESGVDRQRLLAVSAAEAGVDTAYTAIIGGGLAPPCTIANGNVRSGPDVASYATQITYYNQAGTALNDPTSPSCVVSGTPVRAVIRSRAVTNVLGGGSSRGERAMEALVDLSPVNGQTLTNAIFASGSLNFDNKTTITGNQGPDANIYSNTSISCANNENFAGSLSVFGTATLSNGCTLAGNLWASGNVLHDSAWNGSVSGFVKSGSGLIKLDQGPGTVGGNLYAAGTIKHDACPSKCFAGSSPGNPPQQPFPILKGDATALAAWTAGSSSLGGYKVVTNNDCSTGSNGVLEKIRSDYSQRGATDPRVLVRTTCLVALGSEDLSLKNDLVIMANGGITTGKMTLGSSPTGTKRVAHFIIPYDAVSTIPCSSPVLDTDKQFDLDTSVDLFLYSPCDITYRNSSKHIGQIYGGSDVKIRNQFTMQYRPVPVLGIDPSSMQTLGFTPSVVYKREVR